MIALGELSTLERREAFDRLLASGGGPHLRADDAEGQAAMARCLARGTSQSDCTAIVESAIDSRGFVCVGTLKMTADDAGRVSKVCVHEEAPSDRKLAILEAEAAARQAAATRARRMPFVIGGAVILGVSAFFLLK